MSTTYPRPVIHCFVVARIHGYEDRRGDSPSRDTLERTAP